MINPKSLLEIRESFDAVRQGLLLSPAAMEEFQRNVEAVNEAGTILSLQLASAYEQLIQDLPTYLKTNDDQERQLDPSNG